MAQFQNAQNSYIGPISVGDKVHSDFSKVPGISFKLDDFLEPHIGIAGKLSNDGTVSANARMAQYWHSLGAPDTAIWQPGSMTYGSEIVEQVVVRATQYYLKTPLAALTSGHDIWGEYVDFDRVPRSDDATTKLYNDQMPHIDFIAAEIPVTTLFGSNVGGTTAWRGSYTYQGTIKSEYRDEANKMESVDVEKGEFIFSADARTFMHARSARVENQGRALFRIFIGPSFL